MGDDRAGRADASRTAECSTPASRRPDPGPARVAPQTAALIASVPPEVNTTWRGRTPNRLGNLLPAVLQRGPHHAALGVDPSGIGRDARLPPTAAMAVAGLGSDRGGRGVVEVVTGHGRLAGQTTAAQASSPRARDDDSTTGTVPSGVLAAQPGQQALDHPPVDGAEDRVLRGGVAERAVVRHHRGGRALVLGVGGEAVGGEGVGDGVHGGAQRTLACRRATSDRPGSRPYSSPTRSAMPSAAAGPSSCIASCSSRTSRSSRRVSRSSVGSLPTARNRLDGPPGTAAGGPLHGDLEVAARWPVVEVVAGHVGWSEKRAATSEAVAPGFARTKR